MNCDSISKLECIPTSQYPYRYCGFSSADKYIFLFTFCHSWQKLLFFVVTSFLNVNEYLGTFSRIFRK